MDQMGGDKDPLIVLLAEIFETDYSNVHENTAQEDLTKWDSLRQIILTNVLEQRYGLRIKNDVAAKLTSVKAIRAFLDKAGKGGTETPVPSQARSAAPTDLGGLRAAMGRTPTLPQIYEAAELLQSPAAAAAWTGPRVRIAVAGSMTIDFLVSTIAYAAFAEGSLPTLYTAPYGSMVQEVLNPESGLYRFKPDVVVLAPDWRDAVLALPAGATDQEVVDRLAEQVAQWAGLWDRLKTGARCRIMQHLFVPPVRHYRGLADRLAPASPVNQVTALNARLIAAAGDRVSWVEVDQLAAMSGVREWSADRHYYASRLPFDPQFLPSYVTFFRAAWRMGAGSVKKVLALDLDNTLWGGVIGDDGVDGIKLGPGSPAGEAFADWGHYIKQLAARGIILAVCSKNNPTLAAEGFEHPHAALKAGDFAAMEISWDDKASGLRRLAAKLNVGIDSFVFADDNPFECDLVRQNVPEVAVVELGDDPSAFIDILEAGRWFDLPVFTREDFVRGEAYQARLAAEQDRESSTDIDSYLTNLQMTGHLSQAGAAEIARLAQMEQKTNQFNVTTRRYTAEQLQSFLDRDDALVLGFELKDRHADHGLVSSLVALVEGETLRIESWLMSCRVFTRTAEQFILNGLLALAKERGVREITGEYKPTSKNIVVADLYERLGFASVGGAEGPWRLSLEGSGGQPLKTFVRARGEPSSGAPAATPTPAQADHKPVDLDALIDEAHVASRRRDFPRAITLWSRIRKQAPERAEGAIYLAEALREERHFARCETMLLEAIAQFPQDPGIRFQYAAAAHSAGDWSETLRRWSEAGARFPGFPEPGHGIGEANLQLGQFAAAEAMFRQTFEAFPDHSWSGLGYAEVASRQGHWPNAIERLRALDRAMPGRPEVLVRLAIALTHGGAVDEARTVINAAAEKFPDNPVVLEHRIWIGSHQQDWPAVLTYADELAATPGKFPVAIELGRQARIHLGKRLGKTLVIYGNCQAAVLNGLMTRMKGLYADFEIVHLLGHVPAEKAKLEDSALGNAVLYWEQFDERESVPMRDELRQKVGGAQRVVYPSLSMFSLWPFNWPDPRNRVEMPRFPHGRYPYDGDMVAMEVAREGLKGEQAFDRYMKLAAERLSNLDGQFERDLEQWQRRDSMSDVKMTDYVLANYKKGPLFYTWGHVSGDATKEVALQLLSKSEKTLGRTRNDLEPELRSLDTAISDFWMPVHPTVAKWHKLSYCADENAVFNVYGRWWTFKEFMIKYIEYDDSW